MRRAAQQSGERFRRELARSREARLEEWRRRPWYRKLRERASELFDEQF